MQAEVFVLGHDAAGLQIARDVKVLAEIGGGGAEPRTQLGFLAIVGEGNAVHRADIGAGVAFDAQARRKDRLDVAVQAALRFLEADREIEPQFDLGLDVLQRDGFVLVRDLETQIGRNVVVVAPFVDAHLLADQIGHRRQPLAGRPRRGRRRRSTPPPHGRGQRP